MSSSSDEEIGSLSQALPVPNIPDNFIPSNVPASAEEYLQHVMWEAKNCPKTVTANVDRSKMRTSLTKIPIKSKAKSPKSYILSNEMQVEIMNNFSKLAAKIESLKLAKEIPPSPVTLPSFTSPSSWCEFCLGEKVSKMIYSDNERHSKSNSDNSNDEDTSSGQKPLLSIVLNIEQRMLEQLFTWNLYWLENFGFSYTQGQWIYSLLSSLEKPILPDLYSILREIIFKCAEIRSQLDNNKHPHLEQLNTIICIIAKGFEQGDLVD